MITKKYNWFKKPIFWGLLLSSFDVFYAFYYFIIPYFYYSFSTKNLMVDFWFFLNHPILVFSGPIFTRAVDVGPHTSPYIILFYNLLIAVLLFFLVYFSFYVFKTAKKNGWFDKPVFFGLLFSLFEFTYTLFFVCIWIVDYSDPNTRERIDFMLSIGRERPFFHSVLDGLLTAVLLFVIGYIFGYIVKRIRKRISVS